MNGVFLVKALLT